MTSPAVSSEPPKGARLSANQANRRRRVIAAATELASEGGYDLVQMRDVAARADVALGTIYRYFESKDQLLAAALAEWTGELERGLDDRPAAGDTPEARVVDVIRRASRPIERNQMLSSALVTAVAGPDQGTHVYQAEIHEILMRILETALFDVEKERRDAVVRILCDVWFAALIGWVHGWRAVTSVRDELEFAGRFLLAGA
ncbi:MAG TPA: TetR family transcriptional regulator [Acidimicrobiales bacterium]